ncbi:MAG: alpha/beta fold hydrolase [Actinomycetota bacterium]
MKRRGLFTLTAAAVGAGIGIAAEKSILKRRRRNDPEAGEDFGSRRGTRARTIDLDDGAQVFVEEVGPRSNSGAVFVHGSALRTDMWHYQMEGLGGHRLVFCDLRGHGHSQPKGKTSYSLATLAADLEAVIAAAGLTEVVIVGHSVGGMVALELCVRKPELLGSVVKGLVLVNTTYGPVAETLIGSGVGLARLERVTRKPFDMLGLQHERIERLRRLVKPSDAIFWGIALAGFGPNASPKQIDFTYQMISETPVDVIFDLIRSYRDFDVTGRLGEVTVPALVVGGTHDRLTVARASEYLAEHLPKAELKMFEGCGHMSMMERHRDFNRGVVGFLDDTLGPVKKSTRTRK